MWLCAGFREAGIPGTAWGTTQCRGLSPGLPHAKPAEQFSCEIKSRSSNCTLLRKSLLILISRRLIIQFHAADYLKSFQRPLREPVNTAFKIKIRVTFILMSSQSRQSLTFQGRSQVNPNFKNYFRHLNFILLDFAEILGFQVLQKLLLPFNYAISALVSRMNTVSFQP